VISQKKDCFAQQLLLAIVLHIGTQLTQSSSIYLYKIWLIPLHLDVSRDLPFIIIFIKHKT